MTPKTGTARRTDETPLWKVSDMKPLVTLHNTRSNRRFGSHVPSENKPPNAFPVFEFVPLTIPHLLQPPQKNHHYPLQPKFVALSLVLPYANMFD